MTALTSIAGRIGVFCMLIGMVGACARRTESGISVQDDRARACDVLLDTGTQEAQPVHFGVGVRGQAAQRAPHLALSFIATDDAPFAAPAVVFDKAKPAHTRILKASCVDALGAPLMNPGIKLP